MKTALVALTAIALSTAGIGTTMAASPQMNTVPNVIASGSIADCDALDGNPESWDTTALANRLTENGVKFSSISTFGNCFKVAVLDAKGNSTIQLYEPDMFNRVQ